MKARCCSASKTGSRRCGRAASKSASTIPRRRWRGGRPSAGSLTEPLIHYYSERRKLLTVDGMMTIEHVAREINRILTAIGAVGAKASKKAGAAKRTAKGVKKGAKTTARKASKSAARSAGASRKSARALGKAGKPASKGAKTPSRKAAASSKARAAGKTRKVAKKVTKKRAKA